MTLSRVSVSLFAVCLAFTAGAGCASRAANTICAGGKLGWSPAGSRCVAVVPPAPPPAPEPVVVVPPPAPEPAPVEVKQEKLELHETVQFESDSAVLVAESRSLLDQVAKALNAHPEIKKVRVEGHTDSRDTDRHNLKLSKRRARAVRDYLVQAGVDETRLGFAGYGRTKPVADNETEEGRFKNRRVEFTIVERDGNL